MNQDDECQGIMCEIAKRIVVNHWETILSEGEIDLGADGYRLIDEDQDIKYLGEFKSLRLFTHKNNFMR